MISHSSSFLAFALLFLCSWPPLASADSEEHAVDGTLILGLKRRNVQSQSVGLDATEHLRIARNRSSIRSHALRKSRNYISPLDNVLEPLGIHEDGYVMPIRLGSPPQIFEVYVDTGSDLVWVPCLQTSETTFYDCIKCEESKHTSPIATFSPLNSFSSKRESCSSTHCLELHTADNNYDPCMAAGCSLRALLEGSCTSSCPPFSYQYGDGLVSGALIRDHLFLPSFPFPNQSCNFVFGCASASLNEPIGIAGFGKSALSFPSQLESQMSYRGFSYCLVSYRFEDSSNVTSPLVLGASAVPEGGSVQYTPMVYNPMYPYYYYVGLQGISINNTHLELPLNLQGFDSGGNGGMIMDSGTTYTHLPQSLYRKLLITMEEMIPYTRSHQYEKRTDFDLCYQTSSENYPGFPTLSFHFHNNVTVLLPSENHFYAFSPSNNTNNTVKVHCLLLQSIDDVGYGPAAIFGNFQQQNFLVIYDIEKARIGFEPKDCAASGIVN